MSYINEEEVRQFLLDTEVQTDREGLGLDLEFSSEEIANAMKRAAREYNSLPPFIDKVTPDRMSADTNMFLDAVAQQIYLTKLQRAMQQDTPYTAGSVNVDRNSRLISHYEKLIKLHGDRFREAAISYKRISNINRFWGPIG